jgi:SOS response regulatory protein OraA/RecX
MWDKPSKTKEPLNEQKAYEYAVFLLSLQLRTIGEIKEKMERRGYTSAIIEYVTDQLRDQKYLDDERYAQVFLDNLKQYKNLGYFGIKKKFLMKKLPPELISKILDEGLTVEDELKIAKRLLKKEGTSGVILSPSASDLSAEALAKVEDEESLNTDDGENYYNSFDEAKSKQKQKLAQKLKARGFRGEVLAKLIF